MKREKKWKDTKKDRKSVREKEGYTKRKKRKEKERGISYVICINVG